MISAYIKGRKIKVVLETEVGDWEIKNYSPERIVESIKSELADRLKYQVLDMIRCEIDNALVKSVAQEVLKDIKIEDVVRKIVSDKITSRIKDIVEYNR